MTRESYSSDQLDQLALRFLDLSSAVRKMSITAQKNGVLSIELNDRKTLEYLDRLELWALKSAAELERAILAHRGAKMAAKMAKGQLSPPEPKKAAGKKRKRAASEKEVQMETAKKVMRKRRGALKKLAD